MNIGDAHSERLISTHHKKFFFDFSCCCECFKIFNHGLICLVFVNFVRLFSDGLSELSFGVSHSSVCFRTDYRNCPFELLYSSVILTVSGLKTFFVRAFASRKDIFLLSRT